MTADEKNRLELRQSWALRLAAEGFKIFSLRHGSKEPATTHGFLDATSDPNLIRQMFEATPEMNYGVTGGLLLDIDTKQGKAGDKRLREIEDHEQIEDWITLTAFSVKTPSGGAHYYMKPPFEPGNSHHFGKGIDVRGGNGYVVGPYCDLIAGRCKESDTPGQYEVVNDVEITDAPAWIVRHLKRKGERDAHSGVAEIELDAPENIERAESFIRARKPAVEKGDNGRDGTSGGDDHTKVTADNIGDLGISEEMCLELLTEYEYLLPGETKALCWNDRCDPPWEINGDKGTLQEKVRNSYRYRTRPLGAKAGVSTDLMNQAMEIAFANSGYDPNAPVPSKWDAIYYRGEALFKREKRREYIIPDVLPAQGLSAAIAKRGSGKTAVMVDMALRIALAADMTWHGHPLTQGRHVVYVCGEDDTGAEEMIRAWCLLHEKKLPERFHFFENIMDLLNADECASFTNFMLGKLDDTAHAVTFFDTWQRATSAAAQSDDKEMQMAWHNAESIVKSLRGPGVIACHPPKDDGKDMTIMGSSIMENSSEALWTIQKQANGQRDFEVTRIKGGKEGTKINFSLTIVGLVRVDEHGEVHPEQDQFGRQRTGIVVVKIGGKDGDATAMQSAIALERQAYAQVIHTLEGYRNQSDSEYHQKEPFGIKKLVEVLMELPTTACEFGVDKVPTARALRAKELVDKLEKFAGLKTFQRKLIEVRIDALFANQHEGIPVTDKYVVALREKVTGRRRFYIEERKSLMPSDTLDSPINVEG